MVLEIKIVFSLHEIEEYQASIVASQLDNGPILLFRADTHTRLHSLEIDRKRFSEIIKCDLQKLKGKIKSLFEDVHHSHPIQNIVQRNPTTSKEV